MDDMNYSGTDVEYETEEKKNGFRLTRGMLILIVIAIVIIISVIVIVVSKLNKNKPEYSKEDFLKLENRMIEEAPLYVSQKQIELNSEQIKIDLKDLLYENGGSIDSNKIKAAKICKGYVIAVKKDYDSYSAYISCGNLYKTKGYKDEKTTTTTKSITTKKNNAKPNIIIIGDATITMQVGDTYKELGADATDEEDGDISSKVKISGSVDTSKAGTYIITYSVTDSKKQSAEAKRTIIVENKRTATITKTTTKAPVNTTKAPVITRTTARRINVKPTINLVGSNNIKLVKGARYDEPGFSAYDANGTNITSRVTVNSNLNTSLAGTYYIKYSVTDSYGNSSSVTRTIRIEDNYIKLRGISLSPSGNIVLKKGSSKTLRVSFTPSNASNKNISWKSSNENVATVSNGTVYAKSGGTAKITVSGADGKSYSVIINVIN